MTHLDAAITEIDQRIDAIDAERERLVQAREALRGLMTAPLPLAKPRVVKMPSTPRAQAKPKNEAHREAVIALHTGALRPIDLESQTHLSRYHVLRVLQGLQDAGLVTVSGVTNSRRFALTSKGSRTEPKEAVR
jgi:hypothetical protein